MKHLTFKEFLQEAYMSQEHKKELEPNIKKVLQKYGMKGTISVQNNSGIVVTLTQGKLDFNADRVETHAERERRIRSSGKDEAPNLHDGSSVNVYWIKDHWKGKTKDFLLELLGTMRGSKYHDRSDQMTDYFDTSHYTYINIGKYNKPYIVK